MAIETVRVPDAIGMQRSDIPSLEAMPSVIEGARPDGTGVLIAYGTYLQAVTDPDDGGGPNLYRLRDLELVGYDPGGFSSFVAHSNVTTPELDAAYVIDREFIYGQRTPLGNDPEWAHIPEVGVLAAHSSANTLKAIGGIFYDSEGTFYSEQQWPVSDWFTRAAGGWIGGTGGTIPTGTYSILAIHYLETRRGRLVWGVEHLTPLSVTLGQVFTIPVVPLTGADIGKPIKSDIYLFQPHDATLTLAGTVTESETLSITTYPLVGETLEGVSADNLSMIITPWKGQTVWHRGRVWGYPKETWPAYANAIWQSTGTLGVPAKRFAEYLMANARTTIVYSTLRYINLVPATNYVSSIFPSEHPDPDDLAPTGLVAVPDGVVATTRTASVLVYGDPTLAGGRIENFGIRLYTAIVGHDSVQPPVAYAGALYMVSKGRIARVMSGGQVDMQFGAEVFRPDDPFVLCAVDWKRETLHAMTESGIVLFYDFHAQRWFQDAITNGVLDQGHHLLEKANGTNRGAPTFIVPNLNYGLAYVLSGSDAGGGYDGVVNTYGNDGTDYVAESLGVKPPNEDIRMEWNVALGDRYRRANLVSLRVSLAGWQVTDSVPTIDLEVGLYTSITYTGFTGARQEGSDDWKFLLPGNLVYQTFKITLHIPEPNDLLRIMPPIELQFQPMDKV